MFYVGRKQDAKIFSKSSLMPKQMNKWEIKLFPVTLSNFFLCSPSPDLCECVLDIQELGGVICMKSTCLIKHTSPGGTLGSYLQPRV